ncbi:MAG: hypothetical protein PWQ55_1717 [Chloroflexota bacterium]|nr:hypothetical protein [Chloroflexota bacterium]
MDVIEYIRRQMAGMRRSVNGTMQNMTSELFNYPSPGTANTISATFVHMISSEDHFIQEVLQDKATVWENGQWSEKVGIPKPPGIGEDWSEYKQKTLAIQPQLDYAAAVWAATDAYIESLTPEDLDRKVKFAGSERTVGEMLLTATSQELGHNGEISALKGVQGAKGLPI